jgi:hypothetical protein
VEEIAMLTKQELKSWTDALRSGEYTQGKMALKGIHPDGYFSHCCLGVLCEIQDIPQERGCHCYRFDNYSVLLPNSLAVKFGSNNGNFKEIDMPPIGGFHSLARANDEGVSFAEIADHLDKYYPAV